MKRITRYISSLLLAALAMTACTDDATGPDGAPLPDGYGRLRLTIGTADALATRAVPADPWLEGAAAERAIHSYVLLVCDGTTILQAITSADGATLGAHDDEAHRFPATATLLSDPITSGEYTLTFYCLANFTADMLTDVFGSGGAAAIGSTLPTEFEAKALHLSNSTTLPASGMPMTGKLQAEVLITSGQTTTRNTSNEPLVLTLWRMMAKMELQFVNHGEEPMDILGIEIDPLSNGSAGTRLLQVVDLAQHTNWQHGQLALISNPTVKANGPWLVNDVTDGTPPVENTLVSVAANNGSSNGTASIAFYVNETDTSYTARDNQLSLRFKVKRNGTYTEYRYGFTSPYIPDNPSAEGFNVICRNDWLKIPIHFTDWQFRVEALPFPPIAGFQSRLATADALSITFSTGGYIVLRPQFRKSSDPEGEWRTFDDSDVTFDIATGLSMTGDTSIFEQPFSQLPSGDIVAKLTNDEIYGTVTVTLRVTLGGFSYQFDYNIIKKK